MLIPIALALLSLFCTPIFAQNQERPVPVSDDPAPSDYQAASDFGFSRLRVDLAKIRIKNSFDSSKTESLVAEGLETELGASNLADKSLEHLINRADLVLRETGHSDLAEGISNEYFAHFKGIYGRMALSGKELGDHEPLSEWLTKTHAEIEAAIGATLCKYFHLHDLYIFNYATPVVFAPKSYTLLEYLLHFSGSQKSKWTWNYHGLAGVITYWTVDIACMAGTSGLGAVTFVCGPVAELSEHFMDKKIAPPIGTKIWNKNQG